jgi:ribose transport system permease protein
MNEVTEKAKVFKDIARDTARRLLRHENGVLGIILAVIVAVLAGMTRGATVTWGNISNVWLQSATRGIAAVGQLFVILTAGIDVSIGGIGLLSAVLGATLMTGQTGIPAAEIGIMLLVGLGFGALNGALVSRIGMPSLIVTLAMWQICKGVAYIICRGITIRHLPESISFLGSGNIGGVPTPVVVFIGVAVVAYLVLSYTTFGRCVYAVGGNPVSAWLSGINVKNTYLSVFIISGFLGALAGLIMTARTMCGGLNTVVGLELDSIAAVVIGGVSLMGGRGNVIGAVLGVMILGIINNGMNVLTVDPAYQDVVKGMIILAAVAIDFLRRR